MNKDIEYLIIPDWVLTEDEDFQKLKSMYLPEHLIEPLYINFKSKNFPNGIDIVFTRVRMVDDEDDPERCSITFGLQIMRYAGIEDINPYRDEIGTIASYIMNDLLEQGVSAAISAEPPIKE